MLAKLDPHGDMTVKCFMKAIILLASSRVHYLQRQQLQSVKDVWTASKYHYALYVDLMCIDRQKDRQIFSSRTLSLFGTFDY